MSVGCIILMDFVLQLYICTFDLGCFRL